MKLHGSEKEVSGKLSQLVAAGELLLRTQLPTQWEPLKDLQAERQVWVDFSRATLETSFDSEVADAFEVKATPLLNGGSVRDYFDAETDAIRDGVTYLRSLVRRLSLLSRKTDGTIKQIPFPVIATVSDILALRFTHAKLDLLFTKVGLAKEPLTGMNKVDKARAALGNLEKSNDPAGALGMILEELMECDPIGIDTTPPISELRNRVAVELSKHGLEYAKSGKVIKAETGTVGRNLEQLIRDHDLSTLQAEFDRISRNIENDPASAVTSSCALLESLFRIFIEDCCSSDMPSDKSIKPLWNVVRKQLRFDPVAMQDEDLRKTLSGLGSLVDGIAGLRTHRGSAHGQGRKGYRLKPRHARLCAHAAATLATFVVETWDERKNSSS